MEQLADPEQLSPSIPTTAWQRIRVPSRKPEVLGRLKALAAWREHEAQDKNLPRGRIVKDETLADHRQPSAQGTGRPRQGARPFGKLEATTTSAGA